MELSCIDNFTRAFFQLIKPVFNNAYILSNSLILLNLHGTQNKELDDEE